MALTPEHEDVLKLMRCIVESYQTLGVENAHALKRLARDHFKVDLDIAPTIAAVHSRKGNLITAEINRLRAAILEIEERGA